MKFRWMSILLVLSLIPACSSNDSNNSITQSQNLITYSAEFSRGGELDFECCNNLYPSGADSSWLMSIGYCEDEDETTVTGYKCGKYWSHLVTSPTGTLGYEACEVRPSTVKAVGSFSGSDYRGHPKLNWSFIYGHGYVIKKKVGGGSWNTVKTISSNTTLTWTDSGQNLPPIQTTRYKIYSKVYNTLASTAPQVTFYPPSD